MLKIPFDQHRTRETSNRVKKIKNNLKLNTHAKAVFMKKNLNVHKNKQQGYVGGFSFVLKRGEIIEETYTQYSSDFDNIINLLSYPTK